MIDDDSFRVAPLLALALAQYRAGDATGARESCDKAMAIAERNTDDSFNLGSTAKTLAQIGEFDRAQAVARNISDPLRRSQLQAQIAQGQALAGDVAGARKTAADLAPNVRGALNYVIAVHLADSGDIAGAKALLPNAGNPIFQDKVRERIAVALIRAGKMQDAVAMAGQLADQVSQARVYSFAAITSTKAGKKADADRFMDLAQNAAHATFQSLRPDSEAWVAAGQSRMHGVTAAITAIKSVETDPHELLRAFAEAAEDVLVEP